MRQCDHVQKYGYVSNQDLKNVDKSIPLASRTVCHRERCIEAAKDWVWKNTHRDGVLVVYPKREQK